MSIKAEGNWSEPLFESEPMWNLNYSDILTQLIQYAGRFCESYASDLFIIWKYSVENKLKDPDLKSYSVTFGFREMGVDHDVSTDEERIVVARHQKDNSYYYRKVAKLDITIEGSKIVMELN